MHQAGEAMHPVLHIVCTGISVAAMEMLICIVLLKVSLHLQDGLIGLFSFPLCLVFHPHMGTHTHTHCTIISE